MTLHTRCLDDVAPQPWKNGGGVTRELFTWPQPDAWALRLSVADIACDGPFSAFPGIDRWIAVLEGAGADLAAPFNQRITCDTTVYAFDGQYPVMCTLVDGPTRDLNLMVDRSRGEGGMRELLNSHAERHVADEDPARASAALTLRGVFCLEALDVKTPHARLTVPPRSWVWSEDDTQHWQVRTDGRAWAVAFRSVK